MKTLGGLSVVLILSGALFAQNRSGFVNNQGIVRSFPSVIYPGGTSALPGVQRTVGSVLHPGGGTQIAVPGIPFQQGNIYSYGSSGLYSGRRSNGGVVNSYAVPVAVPVPVYLGNGYGNGYDDPSAYAQGYASPAAAGPGAPAQAPPNVIIIYPQGAGAPPPYGMPPAQPAMVAPAAQTGDGSGPAAQTGETATHYFIALKDHSIYSAVAYWVDGDTLHYFTTGSTHNEVSLSLVDRDLTKRLNDESGLQLSLPAAK